MQVWICAVVGPVGAGPAVGAVDPLLGGVVGVFVDAPSLVVGVVGVGPAEWPGAGVPVGLADGLVVAVDVSVRYDEGAAVA